MKKVCLFFLLNILGVCPNLRAWSRLGAGAQPVTQNAGDKAKGISVTISSVSASQIFTGQPYYREILLQNSSATYYVYCGTYSAVTSAAGQPKWILPPKPTAFTTNGTFSIYCLAEPAAGATTIEINGSIEYEFRDFVQ